MEWNEFDGVCVCDSLNQSPKHGEDEFLVKYAMWYARVDVVIKRSTVWTICLYIMEILNIAGYSKIKWRDKDS